jgi:hypothetical protein
MQLFQADGEGLSNEQISTPEHGRLIRLLKVGWYAAPMRADLMSGSCTWCHSDSTDALVSAYYTECAELGNVGGSGSDCGLGGQLVLRAHTNGVRGMNVEGMASSRLASSCGVLTRRRSRVGGQSSSDGCKRYLRLACMCNGQVDVVWRRRAGFSDPYVVLEVFPSGTTKPARERKTTRVQQKTLNPTFNESFALYVTAIGRRLARSLVCAL